MNSRENTKLPPGIESDIDPSVTNEELEEALMEHCKTAHRQQGELAVPTLTPETAGPVSAEKN